MRARFLFLAGGLAMLFCHVAAAQRLLVTTTTMTVARQAAKCYLQSVDIGYGAPLPGPEPLPGISPVGPLLALPEQGLAVQSSGPVWTGGEFEEAAMWTYASLFKTAPFQPMERMDFTPGWREFAGCMLSGESPGETVVVMLGTAPGEDGAWQGFVEMDTFQAGPGKLSHASPPLRNSFPGTPVAAVSLPKRKQVAVLCRDSYGRGAVLRMFDAKTGDMLFEPYPFTGDHQLAGVPSGLALSRNGQYLLVLISGYCLERESGDAVSWVHVVSAGTLTEECDPIELPGSARVETLPLQPADNDTCWVATQPPGTDFAYATLLHLAGRRIEKVVEYPLAGVSGPFHIAPAPSGTDVAVAIGNRLEIWQGGVRKSAPETFEGPIGAIQWTPEGLIMGEVARIHLLAPPSPKPVKTIQLQSGWVTNFVLLPAATLPAPDSDADGIPDADEALLGTSPASPDTDGDGIPDGADPEPATPSPRLQLPTAITFRGEGVGQEIKAFSIDSAHGKKSTWKVQYDKQAMPWLVIHPLEGNLPGVVYMGVDPGRYTPGKLAWGNLTVSLTGTTPDKPAAGSPCTVQVRVLPEKRSDVRRILWLWDKNPPGDNLRAKSDPHRLQALADLLAAPPYYFAHREAAGPFLESLDPYTIVVLGAQAAARGAVTRQALLDYVKNGGALLLLGKYLPDTPDPQLSEWLSPLGIQIDTSVRVDGAFKATGAHWLCRYWDRAAVHDGCAIYDTDPASILVPDTLSTQSAVFVARSYGLGRIAMLAADTPLESDAMKTPQRRQFAADLFHWLSSAGRDGENQDMDGDGLSDNIEDKNHNGIVDPGETDYLNPDTDGDGIPDGMEDVNLNGRVDEGETSPLNPDSNGNGIMDGADFNPLPPAGAPCVDALSPSDGPAEGGKVVSLLGRGFAPDAVVWFGNRQAPTTRVISKSVLLTEIPPCESASGGDVAVKVVNAGSKLEGVLPGGFHYSERGKATFTLKAMPPEGEQPASGGQIILRLACPADTMVGHLDLMLEVEPPGAATLGKVEAADPAWSGQLTTKADPAGNVEIVMTRGPLNGPIEGPIAKIQWKAVTKKAKGKNVTIKIAQPHVMIQNGQPLDVIVKNLSISPSKPKP